MKGIAKMVKITILRFQTNSTGYKYRPKLTRYNFIRIMVWLHIRVKISGMKLENGGKTGARVPTSEKVSKVEVEHACGFNHSNPLTPICFPVFNLGRTVSTSHGCWAV